MPVVGSERRGRGSIKALRSRPGVRWVGVGAASLVLTVAIWLLPLALTGGERAGLTAVERLKAENDIRSTLVTVLAVGAALAGLTFTGRTYLLNVSGQVTDRYSTAVGQLGHEQIAVRVGAVYALERVAKDSVPDRDAIAEVLCTFVRAATPLAAANLVKDQPGPEGSGDAKGPQVDVQAAVRVLGREPLCLSTEPVDLRRSDLRGVDFSYTKLPGAWLREAWLMGAQFRASTLEGAWLSEARLDGADLDSAFMQGARLRGAVLDDAVLKGAHLEDAMVEDASFKGTWLAGAHLSRGQLSAQQLAQARGVRNGIWHN